MAFVLESKPNGFGKNSTNKHQKPIKRVIFARSKNRSSTLLRGYSFVTALSTLAIPLWDNEILSKTGT